MNTKNDLIKNEEKVLSTQTKTKENNYYEIYFISGNENYDYEEVKNLDQNKIFTHIYFRIGKTITRRRFYLTLRKEEIIKFYNHFLQFIDCGHFDDIKFYLTIGLIITRKEHESFQPQFYHWSRAGTIAYFFYLIKQKPLIREVINKVEYFYKNSSNVNSSEIIQELSFDQCVNEI